MKNKKCLKVLLIIVGIIFVLGITKNMILKAAVTIGAGHVTGAKVTIKKFSLGIFSQSIHIKEFRMYNPKGFPKEVMVDIPEIRIDCDIPALLGGKLHLPLVILDLKELMLVTNKDGQLNVDALKVAQTDDTKAEEPKDSSKKSEKKKKSEPLAMQIDVLKLNLGKLVQKDYSKGDTPEIKVIDIGINDKTYKNITSAQQFITLVLVESMGPAALKGAKIYAASALLGAGFLPVGVASVLLSESGGTEEFNVGFSQAFKAALEAVQSLGEVKKQDESSGVIKAKVQGADVSIRVKELESNKTSVKVTARKLMIPNPKIAKGVLHQIGGNLK